MKKSFIKEDDSSNIINIASQNSIQNNKNQQHEPKRSSIGLNYINNAKQRQFAAGSNFDIIKLETGVDLTEDSKFKSGGKDFFKKFQRYSLENFERQFIRKFRKTTKSNCYCEFL